ncbi:cytochrome b561 and DOMON domain-containing protein At3g61750-like [Oryza brachyantha]|uniref:Cytochrome b561 and DOMON domain-containing protein n=1 Tax=Oryza brachyantha TaxID=4533 RepID=J3M560_ORYBR|nr:cytochrome b561 and DOMON domain-containing protein At3g61750-like [Oryza brachyantha]
MAVPKQVQIVLFVTVILAAVAVHAQRDTCGAELNTFLPAPFNSSRLLCRSVWNGFILRYSHLQIEDDTTNIVLSAPYSSGWVGIGFSNDGKMVGSSAMVGWIDNQGRAYIKQYYLSSQASSGVKVDEGKLPTTDVHSAAVLYGDNIYLAFQLKSPLHIARQSVILALSKVSPNKFHLAEHDDKTTLSFDFSSGDSVSTYYYPYRLKRNHGAFAILGWGVLVPLGAIVARYLRHKDPLWYYLHVLLQFMGYIIGLAGAVSGIALYNRTHSNFTTHKSLGFSVLALGSLQVIAFFIHPDKDSQVRKCWNQCHHWLGRLCIFLAAINTVLGIESSDTNISWKVGYGAVISVLLISATCLEIVMCTRLSKEGTCAGGLQMPNHHHTLTVT